MSWSPPDAPLLSRPAPAYGEPVPRRVRWPRDTATALLTTAVVVLMGAPLGLLWSALAPHSHVAVEAGGAYIADAETEVFVAGDGWFVGLTLLAGVLTGIVAYALARRSGPFVVVGLVLGGLIAAYVASKVGVRIGQDALEAAVRSGRLGRYVGNVALQTDTAWVAWPLGAVTAFGSLIAVRPDELD